MARTVTFTVPPEYDDKKLCAFLRGEAQISYALYATLRHISGSVTRGGVPVRSIDRVHTGDAIRVAFPAEQTKLLPTPMELRILYEDDDLLVLDKSGFLAMHPSHGHQTDTLANGVTDYLQKSGSEGAFHAVGRLDKGTSGVVLCAKHTYAASRMNGQTEKTYLALVEGAVAVGGTLENDLVHDPTLPFCRMIDFNHNRLTRAQCARLKPLHAVTQFKPLDHLTAENEPRTLLEVTIRTGVTHQIRAQLALAGMHIVNDRLYGAFAVENQVGHCLHALAAAFAHPVTGTPTEIRTPYPTWA